MNDPAIATAADYADALLTARRAKNLLVLLVLLMLLGQIALFFVARNTNLVIQDLSATTQPSTQPSARAIDGLHYLVGASNFLGIVLSIVLSCVLVLIVHIMLVGRLIGVARATSAFIWCLLLIALLFPWQAFLNNATFTAKEFMVPGVLFTWDELHLAKFDAQSLTMPELILKWARFVGMPVVAVLIALAIQVKSNRGLRQALGETELDQPV